MNTTYLIVMAALASANGAPVLAQKSPDDAPASHNQPRFQQQAIHPPPLLVAQLVASQKSCIKKIGEYYNQQKIMSCVAEDLEKVGYIIIVPR